MFSANFCLQLIGLSAFISSAASIYGVQCYLSSLSPNMGPIQGSTAVSMNIDCNTQESELIFKLFEKVHAYFDSVQTRILSVNLTGFVSTRNTGIEEPQQIAWVYSISVE